MYKWLHRVWYEGSGGYRLLLPLSGALNNAAAAVRNA